MISCLWKFLFPNLIAILAMLLAGCQTPSPMAVPAPVRPVNPFALALGELNLEAKVQKWTELGEWEPVADLAPPKTSAEKGPSASTVAFEETGDSTWKVTDRSSVKGSMISGLADSQPDVGRSGLHGKAKSPPAEEVIVIPPTISTLMKTAPVAPPASP